MYRVLFAVVVLVATAAPAQPSPPSSKPQPTMRSSELGRVEAPKPEAPIKSELDKLFDQLAGHVREADKLVEQLRSTASKTPDAARKEVDNAAAILSGLADRLQDTGDIAQQLQALRKAAQVHRKRVMELPPNIMEELDRTEIMGAWDSTVCRKYEVR